jgi:hypothetical protein
MRLFLGWSIWKWKLTSCLEVTVKVLQLGAVLGFGMLSDRGEIGGSFTNK